MNNLTSLPAMPYLLLSLSFFDSDCLFVLNLPQRVRQGEGARGEQGRVHAAQGEGKVGQGNERVSRVEFCKVTKWPVSC